MRDEVHTTINQDNQLTLAERLTQKLPSGLQGLFNPWADHCPYETDDDGPNARLARLSRHLDCNPAFILVGEAAGYQGCRYSGIAFTSERLLIELTPGAFPLLGA